MMLGFIGSGNMAEAIARGVVARGVVSASGIIASDVRPERLGVLRKLGAVAATSNREVAEKSETVILAVKPQNVPGVLPEIAGLIRPPKLLVSICAGVPTAAIESALGELSPVVRVMPNTPLLVGKGMSALSAGRWAGEKELERTRRIFEAVGRVLVLPESKMDAVTAVSGSGPAYFFYLAEAMIEAALAEGLSPEEAEALVRATAEGAGALLAESSEKAQELRRRVTSPGGTTEAAVKVLESAGVKEALVAAVRRAAERSRELGRRAEGR
jgi:pyrroline-5-carboxylate reductase